MQTLQIYPQDNFTWDLWCKSMVLFKDGMRALKAFKFCLTYTTKFIFNEEWSCHSKFLHTHTYRHMHTYCFLSSTGKYNRRQVNTWKGCENTQQYIRWTPICQFFSKAEHYTLWTTGLNWQTHTQTHTRALKIL